MLCVLFVGLRIPYRELEGATPWVGPTGTRWGVEGIQPSTPGADEMIRVRGKVDAGLRVC